MKQLAFWSGLLFPLAIVSAQNTYSISGQVATLDITVSPDTMPLPGATITLSGSQIGTVRTDNNGRYSFNNLAAGGTYTVTPSRLTNSGVGTFNALGANQTANFFSPSNSARSELTVFRPAAHPEWIMDMNKSFAYEDTDGVTFLGLPDDQPIVLGGTTAFSGMGPGTWTTALTTLASPATSPSSVTGVELAARSSVFSGAPQPALERAPGCWAVA